MTEITQTPVRTDVPAETRRGSRPPAKRRLLLWLLLGVGGLLMIAPFYWTLATSFKSRQEVRQFPPTWYPEDFTLENWEGLTDLDVGDFGVFFRNSLVVVTTITGITLLTSSLAGYVFAKFEFWGRDALFWIVISMLMVPFSVTLVPLYNMMVDWDWTNTYRALIVPIIFNPFGIFLMRQFMLDFPSELLDAARIDGASEFGIFFRIVLPLSGAPLAALAIFTFTIQWDNFLWPLVILEDPSKYTLPIGLSQFRGRTGIDVGAVSAAAMLAVLPVLILYFFAQKRFIEGITMTGMKG